MTKEQEKVFKKELWRWFIDDNGPEYDIALNFYELGLKQNKL